MKTLKIFLSVLLICTLLFLGLLIYTVHYSDHGPDGLSGFWGGIFFGGAFIICVIGSISIGSIVMLPNISNTYRFIGATLFSILVVYTVLVFTLLPAIRFW